MITTRSVTALTVDLGTAYDECRASCLMKFPLIKSNRFMDPQVEFQTLLERVRRGDQQAAADLVENYEPVVRRFIRFRLSSPALRRTFDSLDICQSVLCKCFVDVSAGELQLHDPRQLKGGATEANRESPAILV